MGSLLPIRSDSDVRLGAAVAIFEGGADYDCFRRKFKPESVDAWAVLIARKRAQQGKHLVAGLNSGEPRAV